MQHLSSPRGSQPTSPPARGPPAYPEEERGGAAGYTPFSAAPPLPDRPPFKAYLGNIPYDLDEEVVAHFFRGLDVSWMLLLGRLGGMAGLGSSGSGRAGLVELRQLVPLQPVCCTVCGLHSAAACAPTNLAAVQMKDPWACAAQLQASSSMLECIYARMACSFFPFFLLCRSRTS